MENADRDLLFLRHLTVPSHGDMDSICQQDVLRGKIQSNALRMLLNIQVQGLESS